MKKLSPKFKLYTFIGATAAILLIYTTGPLQTLMVKRNAIASLEKKLNIAAQANIRIPKLRLENKTAFANYFWDSNSLDFNSAYESIDQLCAKNKVRILSYNQPQFVEKKNFAIYYLNLTLEGPYANTIKTIKDFDDELDAIKVGSASFELQEDRRTKRQTLHTTVYLQIVSLK